MATRVMSDRDASEPIVRRKALSARNDAGTRTVIDMGVYGTIVTDEPVAHGGTGRGPSPLQTVLGALCGCESVTFHQVAGERDFSYGGIDFDASFTIDLRGKLGNPDVRPHFRTVRVRAVVETDEGEDRLREVVEETERRCPVFNLVSDAGVRVEMHWIAGSRRA